LDRTQLATIVGLKSIDLHSVDSLARSMRTQDSFRIEHLFLKAVSDPSPSEGRFENVPCVLIQSSRSTRRASLLFIQRAGEVTLDDPPWVREAACGGWAVLGISLPTGEPLAKAVAKALKGVSYLDLRRDIVDRGEIVVWSRGESGVGGLISAVLDDRVKGVVAENLPRELSLPSGESIETVAVYRLLPPKRLMVFGHRGRGDGFEGVTDAYQKAGWAENVRFEEEPGRDGLQHVLNWGLGGIG
jgi:hypothetical protein